MRREEQCRARQRVGPSLASPLSPCFNLLLLSIRFKMIYNILHGKSLSGRCVTLTNSLTYKQIRYNRSFLEYTSRKTELKCYIISCAISNILGWSMIITKNQYKRINIFTNIIRVSIERKGIVCSDIYPLSGIVLGPLNLMRNIFQ